MRLLFLLFFTISCSSVNTVNKKSTDIKVRNSDFTKETPLLSGQVADYYKESAKGQSPALQDETLDRFSKDEILTINKKQQDPMIELAILCSTRNFDRAFEISKKMFTKYQKIAGYWNIVGNCHINQGAFRKALLFYNKALEISPNYTPSLNNIGVMYMRQGQDQKALIAFNKAYATSKFSKTPRYNLANLYLRYGLSEEALPIFESLLSESPQDIYLLNAVASSHFLNSDYLKAYSYYQKIPKEQFIKSDFGLNYAVTVFKMGNLKESKLVFNNIKTVSSSAKDYYRVVSKVLGEAE